MAVFGLSDLMLQHFVSIMPNFGFQDGGAGID